MHSLRKTAIAYLLLLTAWATSPAYADPVGTLTSFSSGTPAVASEVNGNFTTVSTAVNDNDARIVALEALVADLQASSAATQTELETEIAALRTELNNVLAVNQYLSLETVNDNPAVRITGANLQLVNGTGRTNTSNGTGNVIIGYDELRDTGSIDPQCSIGTASLDGFDIPITTEGACTSSGGTWLVNHKSGSHYLVVGIEHNYSQFGGFVAGRTNTSNNLYSTVSGGWRNTAAGNDSSVSGGFNRSASQGLDWAAGSLVEDF